jgi:hypothetical protein
MTKSSMRSRSVVRIKLQIKGLRREERRPVPGQELIDRFHSILILPSQSGNSHMIQNS